MKLQNNNIDLYYSSSSIRVIQSKRMWCS